MTSRSDNFNRADGAIGTPSDGGSAWVTGSGTWLVTSNQAQESTGSVQGSVVLETSESNGDVQATMVVFNGDGVVGRWADDNNYIFAAPRVSDYIVYKKVAGSFTSLANPSVTLGANPVVKLSFDASNNINLYHNGVLVTNAGPDAAGSTNTKFGMWSNFNAAARWDDWSFTGVAPPPVLYGSLGEFDPLLRPKGWF